MNAALAVISLALGLASFVLVVVVPIRTMVANRRLVLRNEDRHVSLTPVVGSVVGFVAIVIAPLGTLGGRLAWSWTPLALELATTGFGVAYWRWSGLGKRAERQRLARRRDLR